MKPSQKRECPPLYGGNNVVKYTSMGLAKVKGSFWWFHCSYLFFNAYFFVVSDYESTQFQLAFPAGVRGPRSKCGAITVTDDLLVEGDESVALMAGFLQSSSRISLVSNTATIIVTDNDCK